MLEQKSFESKNVDVGHKNVETNGNLGTSFLYSMKSKEPSISTAPIISPRKQTFEIENKINSTNKENHTSSPTTTNIMEIGWLFVHEYYVFLNKQPSHLHRFYGKNSCLIHGIEGESVKTLFGEMEINEKIESLKYKNCKVTVTNVDCQASKDSGILIQVVGFMSNNDDEVPRKFVQTFFLATQTDGYYVENDHDNCLNVENPTLLTKENLKDYPSSTSPVETLVEEDISKPVFLESIDGSISSTGHVNTSDISNTSIPPITADKADSTTFNLNVVQTTAKNDLDDAVKKSETDQSIRSSSVSEQPQQKSIVKSITPNSTTSPVIQQRTSSAQTIPNNTATTTKNQIIKSPIPKPSTLPVTTTQPINNTSQPATQINNDQSSLVTSVVNQQVNNLQKNATLQSTTFINDKASTKPQNYSEAAAKTLAKNDLPPPISAHQSSKISPQVIKQHLSEPLVAESSVSPDQKHIESVQKKNPADSTLSINQVTDKSVDNKNSSDFNQPQNNTNQLIGNPKDIDQKQLNDSQAGPKLPTPPVKTWASLAANGIDKWKNDLLYDNTKGPLSTTTIKLQKRPSQQQQNRDNKENGDNHDHSQDEQRLGVRRVSVKHLDVVPTRNCAFVEFFTSEAYQNALNAKTLVVNTVTLCIEERRPPQHYNSYNG
ncbi:15808_t:CDS:2 [Entrophospora sp. SA101]|nr:15808_t:CDS:2 [Entrophospora sp. SA101]